jgi:TPR repeat protein
MALQSANHIPLALYEVAMSFQQGWGVSKDKEKAAYYFQLSAQLGDPDAQVALAECFLR